MKEIRAEIAIIGGGPAGLAAALEAKKQGAGKVVLLERDFELGGVLQQCIHDGFGLHRFEKRMAGSQYAQVFVDELEKTDVEIYLNTMVLEVTREKELYACNQKDGMLHIKAGAVIFAMGCRERTASQVFIYGYRPSGVMTAGSVQRYINMEGYLPGKRAVILGSGDIGLIMARRMTLEKMEVEGVYEVMQNPGGLTRNIVQCLEDYGIPLHLATTVTRIHGKDVLEGVTVAQVDEMRRPIKGTERYIPCDLLVLAVGLIPENELSIQAGVELDPRTRGPVLDENFMTNIPGIFAAGNVAVVFDLVDYVSLSGEIAARGAVSYLRGKIAAERPLKEVCLAGNVNFAVPQKVACNGEERELTFFLRVKEPARKARLSIRDSGGEQSKKAYPFVAPPEMLAHSLKTASDQITLKVEEV